MKVFLKVLMWVALVAIVLFVVLWLAIKISGNFNGFGDLFDYLGQQYKEGDGMLSVFGNLPALRALVPFA